MPPSDPTVLISAHDLHRLLTDDPDAVVVLDSRFNLMGADGREEFEAGHVPGARFVDLETELAGSPGTGGRHPLPPYQVFAHAMRRVGVDDDRGVVVVDGGSTLAAARLWWMLTDAGHTDVSVLDGGFKAWTAAGLPVESGPDPEVAPTEFAGHPGRRRSVDAAGIPAALEHGATEVVLGLGGSASTDGGAGLLQALGARLLDAHGEELPLGGGALTGLISVDLAPLRDRVGSTQFVVAIDVDNPLLGPTGAAATFGPQKGADADDLIVLEQGLRTWSEVITRATGRDVTQVAGTGAAGGAGYAAVAVLDATVRPGIELVLELVGFDAAVVGADLVITGEGSLDEQSLSGKAPIGVATAAGQAGVRVVAVAGRNQLSPERLAAAGISQAYALSELEPDVGRSMANAAPLLGQVGGRIAREWLA